MKTIRNLVAFYEENKGRNVRGKILGNHRVEIAGDGSANFIYHWTPIAIIDNAGNVTITNGGWGTPSTTRACNAYKKEFISHGYRVEDIRK